MCFTYTHTFDLETELAVKTESSGFVFARSVDSKRDGRPSLSVQRQGLQKSTRFTDLQVQSKADAATTPTRWPSGIVTPSLQDAALGDPGSNPGSR